MTESVAHPDRTRDIFRERKDLNSLADYLHSLRIYLADSMIPLRELESGLAEIEAHLRKLGVEY